MVQTAHNINLRELNLKTLYVVEFLVAVLDVAIVGDLRYEGLVWIREVLDRVTTAAVRRAYGTVDFTLHDRHFVALLVRLIGRHDKIILLSSGNIHLLEHVTHVCAHNFRLILGSLAEANHACSAASAGLYEGRLLLHISHLLV